MYLDSALTLAAQGFRVFPLAAGASVPPKGFFKFQDQATTDPNKIREFWKTYPDANVGVATGRGLIVVDVDVKKGKKGAESLDALEALGLPTDGYRVKTPSGGVHVFLRTEHPHRQIIDALDGFPGIDIKCEGNYVVGAGSTRRDFPGKPYQPVGSETIPAMPAWLDDIIIKSNPKRTERTEQPLVELDKPSNVANAIEYLEKRAPEAIEGAGGDTTTFQVAARMRDYGLSDAKAWELMLDHWNERKAAPPWEPEELLAKVQNAYAYGTGAWGGEDPVSVMDEVEDAPLKRDPAAQLTHPLDTEDSGGNKHADQTTSGTKILRTLDYAAMLQMQEPEWLIDGVLIRNTSALMFGKSNAFKSFTAIDMALSIATGREWHGCAVQQAKVLLVATEGANGVGRLRVPGWYAHYEIPDELRKNARLYPQEISLDVKDNVDVLIATMRYHDIGLLLLDIFGGTMNGTEVEDTTAREWSRNIQRILRETGATVLTVAHTGWADETRARMHTHFWGSFDTRLKVEGDKEKLISTTTIERHKDADSSGKWGFRMEKSNGTLIPVFDDSVRETHESLPDAQRKAVTALEDALEEAGKARPEPHFPARARIVSVEKWKEHCAKRRVSNSEKSAAQRTAFYRIKGQLVDRGIVGEYDGFVWNVADES